MITTKNKNSLSSKIKDGVKKGLFATLKANANSSGCFIIYQPKTPKGFEKFKNIK
ncbi:MAG: cyclic lactone autoinducer peptide [Ruminococcus bromii]|nr:cyclic lactone autoinducer peptide [Ruminococcus bromii]MEE0008609.1 cyclic lactone autoinducer peptide [Ruminococcus bromii]